MFRETRDQCALVANSQHSSISYTGLPFIHIYGRVLCRSLFPLIAFSFFVPPEHAYTSSHTNILSFFCSISPIPRPNSLSSDFPVEYRRVADQYIIRGFEAYIYYCSDAISTVISLLPLE